MAEWRGAVRDWLIMDDGWSVTDGCLFFDDVDEFKSAADGHVGIGPPGALKVSHL